MAIVLITTISIAGLAVGPAAPAAATDDVIDLGVTWNGNHPSRVVVGTLHSTSVLVTNHGPGTAAAATATFDLPAGAEMVNSSYSRDLPGVEPCEVVDQMVTCTVGDLPADGDFVAVFLTVRQTVPALAVTTTATVTSAVAEVTPDLHPNTISTTMEIADHETDLRVLQWEAEPAARSIVGNPEIAVAWIGNSGPSASDDLTATFSLPDGAQVIEAGVTFGYPGTEPCEIAGETVTCNVGDVPAFGASFVFISFTPTRVATDEVVTVALSSSTPEATPDRFSNTSSTAPFDVVEREVDLTVAWASQPAAHSVVGHQERLILRVTNNGPSVAEATTVTFDLPTEAVIDEVYPSWQFPGGEGCQVTGQMVSCIVGDVAAHSWVDVTVELTPTTPATGLTATASVTSAIAEVAPDPSANTATTAPFDIVDQQVDLGLEWIDEPTPRAVDGNRTYAAVQVTNDGPSIAVDATITFDLPVGADVDEAFSNATWAGAEACEIIDHTVSCNIGDVPAGGTADVYAMFTPTVAASGVTATATVASAVAEVVPDPTTNTVSSTFDVVHKQVDLTVIWDSGFPSRTIVGEQQYPSVRIINWGPSTAVDTTVTIDLPAHADWASIFEGWPGAEDCTRSGGTVTCNVGDVPSGRSSRIYMLATPTTPGTGLRAMASVTSAIPEVTPNPSPNTVATAPFDIVLPTPTITGTVTDDAGAPLAGVEVRVYNASGVTAKVTTTNAVGAYTLDGLAMSTYTLRFARAGLTTEFYSDAPTASSATPIDLTLGGTVTADATLSATVSMTGVVVDDAGVPWAGVEVRAYNAAGVTAKVATTDVAGVFSLHGLAAGTYRLRFARTGVVTEFFSDAVSLATATPITLAPGGAFVADATVSAMASVTGSVTDDSGAPLVGVEVRAYNASGTTAKATTTNAAGLFALDGLAAGTYTLRFARAGVVTEYYSNASSASSATPITLTPGGTFVADATVSLTASVTGAVIDDAGAPLAGVEVRAYTASGTTAKATTTNAAGLFALDGLAAGTYRLRFARAGVVTEFYSDAVSLATAGAITLTPGSTFVADATVSLTASVTGAVTDAGGSPLVGVEVRAYTASGTTAKATTTNAAGFFALDGLAAGTYRLRFARAGVVTEFYSDAVSLATATPITLTPGGTVTADATLTVTSPG